MKGPKGPISPYVGPVVILVVGLFVRFPVVRHRRPSKKGFRVVSGATGNINQS